MNAQNPRLLLPKVDVIFKLLFGDARNSDILIDFLKAVLSLPEDEYEAITLTDTQLKRESLDDKLGIVDVKLATKSGSVVHIEMQVLEQAAMPARVTYYNAKSLVTQLKAGEGYDSLEKTISIVIADFSIVKGSLNYHHVFRLQDKPTGVLFTDLIEINTLELRKIPKETDHTKKYEWLQFLNAEQEEEFQMVAQKNPVIKKAYVELKRLSQDEEAQMLYDAREKALRDEISRVNSAYQKGIEEGEIKGKIEGVIRLIKSLDLTVEKAMELIGLENEYENQLRAVLKERGM